MSDLNDAILAHARKEYPKESCGLIVVKGNQTYYKPCTNLSTSDQHFVLDPKDYASADGEIRAIVHSHVGVPPTPSEADITACNRSNMPWWIVSADTGQIVKFLPENKQSLIGREWGYPIWDCYKLCQDYYAEQGIFIPEFERGNQDWYKNGENKIEENLSYAGFNQVKLSEIKVGDGMLFAIGSKVSNHVGIYYGQDCILHHAYNRLSKREPLTSGLLSRLTMAVRYSND